MAKGVDRLRQEYRRARTLLRRPEVIKNIAVGVFLAASLAALIFYVRAVRQIDEKIAVGPFANTMNLYAAPLTLQKGDAVTRDRVVEYIERQGLSPRPNTGAWYSLADDAIEIHPNGGTSDGCKVAFNKKGIVSIVSVADGSGREVCTLEPRMIANLSSASREKRKPLSYREFPRVLVQAVISAEDKRFFNHSGVDFVRAAKAAYVDLKEFRKEQGASTLTMQLVRSLWLEPDKKWRRKLNEMVMAMHIEEKMTKEQIFEYYANEIYLGRYGTFGLHGFGEAARAFFNKEPRDLNLQEAALLAGLPQAPSLYNPLRYPERAKDRRNVVLHLMKQNGFITTEQHRAAVESPVGVTSGAVKPLESPFLMDLVQDEAQKHIGEQVDSFRVYTSVDLELQEIAERAIEKELPKLDKVLRRVHGKQYDGTPVQVALVAVDPGTGQVKALVGGRDYTRSQLNRALALRQPGSVFKPFVYAAALNTAVEGGRTLITPATMLTDEPSSFMFNGQTYEPGNFGDTFYGSISVRRALAKSVNVATVKLAESVGYNRIADLAHRAGLNHGIVGTPAVALGAYEATPLEIAAAYTAFANLGTAVKPALISRIEDRHGRLMYSHAPTRNRVLDPRVAYLTVNLLEEVMRSGTAAGARGRGFSPPAGGKTGTSRDGWFAGFTSQLVAVVWVGFDDNRDLKLEGSKSALPIWTEFMKLALALPAYKNAKPFKAPAGVISAIVDPDTGELATDYCPSARAEYFIAGTAPGSSCYLHTTSYQVVSSTAVPVQQTLR